MLNQSKLVPDSMIGARFGGGLQSASSLRFFGFFPQSFLESARMKLTIFNAMVGLLQKFTTF
jgi:hypothetical protein